MPAAILAALALLVPLAILPGVFFHYDTVPRIVALAGGCALAVLLPGTARAIEGLWRERSGRSLILLAAGHVLWFTLATGLSSRPWFSLLGNNWRRMGLGTVLALGIFAILPAALPNAARPVLRATSIALTVAAIYGIAQYFDFDPLQNPAGYHALSGDTVVVRPPGTMGHADYFGWWLAVAGFCAAALAAVEQGWWRRLARLAMTLGAAALVLTGTRAAMLGAVAGLALLAAMQRGIAWRRYMAGAAVAAGLLLVFYISPAGERLRARVKWAIEEPVGGARPLLWRDSLRLAAAHPIAGSGPETFAAAFPAYQSEDLSRLLPDFYHESPHNMVLDALAEQGIPGLLLCCGWLVVAAVAGQGALRAGAAEASFLLAAVAASAVAGCFGVATAGPVFATLTAIALLTGLGRHKAEPALAWGPPGLALTALPLVAFAVALAWSDSGLARGSSLSSAALAAKPLDRPGRIPGAGEDMFWSRHLSSACALNPTTRAECQRLATASAVRATDSSDNPALAWYNLAIFTAAMGDARAVERSLRTAIQLAPNWFKPHWSLAELLLLNGRADEARREAERAALLDAGKDAEVTATLQRARAAR